MQLTERDDQMMAWLQVVRVADIDAVRWALAAFGDGGGPVSARRAQQWAARMIGAELLGRFRPVFRDGSVLWARPEGGQRPPNMFRQMMRHEVAVASVSARFLAHGFSWEADRRPRTRIEHQADGVAFRAGERVLVEVELTQKRHERYGPIFASHVFRLEREGVTEVAYFGTPEVMRAIGREAEQRVFRDARPQVTTRAVFDGRGIWTGPALLWASPREVAVPVELEGARG